MQRKRLTPEEMVNLFEKIGAFHRSFKFNNTTIAGWLAAMNKIGATHEEVKEAIIDHAMSEEGKFEPKVANICYHIRKNRGIR